MRVHRVGVVLACLTVCASRGRAGDSPVTGIDALRDLGPVQADPDRLWTIIGYFDADHSNDPRP